jgi:hypothetical protein
MSNGNNKPNNKVNNTKPKPKPKENDPNDIEAFVNTVLSKNRGMIMWYLMEGNPNDSNSEGYTPLTALLIKGSMMSREDMSSEDQLSIIKVFDDADVDFEEPDQNGNFPIFAALFAEFPVFLTVSNIADLHTVKPDDEVNILMAAAGLGLVDITDFFGGQFNLSDKDSNGNTVFHHALIGSENEVPTRMRKADPGEIIQSLCEFGGDPTLENNEGKTPMELAYEKNRHDIALVIRHCALGTEGFFKIKIQYNENETPTELYVHSSDTVLQIKQALFFDKYMNYNLYHVRGGKILVDSATLEESGVKSGDTLRVMPILRTGKGGKTRRHTKKRKQTRRR